ncbi:alpha-hydroxy-acid oxidizing protein [Clostridiaceae bacterium HSG29]|nr:alpha-hydroxy-acid oxidizing protein [Clostridiaceae bacterium HSG29]
MNYNDVRENAKKNIGDLCKVCKNCNGIACRGLLPGPGGIGTGSGFTRSYEYLSKIKVNMDTFYEYSEIDTSYEIFGHTFRLPVFTGPVGGVKLHYGDKYNDLTYSKELIDGCKEGGILPFTGDTIDEDSFIGTLEAVKEVGGFGIPTIKPWSFDEAMRKVKLAEKASNFAIAMDIDAAGLFFLTGLGKPVQPMSVDQIRKIANSTKLPFILKGIMTVKGALKAKEAGVDGIIVSNHGGRVLDHTPAPYEVLGDIVDAVGDDMYVFVDGGIRTGLDIFKAIALGADAVLIGRPFAISVYGGAKEGVSLYIDKLADEFKSALVMTGAKNIKEITKDKLYNNGEI